MLCGLSELYKPHYSHIIKFFFLFHFAFNKKNITAKKINKNFNFLTSLLSLIKQTRISPIIYIL